MDSEDIFKKENGIYYTGRKLAQQMIRLLNIDYTEEFSLIEPAVGEGHILAIIVDKYFRNNKEKSVSTKVQFLVNNIVAFDIREDAVKKTVDKLNNISKKYINEKINWNIQKIDALDIKMLTQFYNRFDYVISNPPYVARKNMETNTVNFLKENSEFSKKYNFDLYYYFFEIGFHLWNGNGKVVYITPNSYLRARGSQLLLDYMISNRILEKVIDFEDELVFEDASTYSAISVFSTNNKRMTIINKDRHVIYSNSYSQLNKSQNYNFYKHTFLKEHLDGFVELGEIAEVRNGIATLNDRVFIVLEDEILHINDSTVSFIKQGITYKIEREVLDVAVRPAIDGKRFFVIFPYIEDNNQKNHFLKNLEFKENYPLAFNYLKNNLNDKFLEKYDIFWGRTQGMRAMKYKKIIIPKVADLENKPFKTSGEGFVLAGISMVFAAEYNKYLSEICEYLNTEDVFSYLRSASKNYAAGYKSISSIDLKQIKIPKGIFKNTKEVNK